MKTKMFQLKLGIKHTICQWYTTEMLHKYYYKYNNIIILHGMQIRIFLHMLWLHNMLGGMGKRTYEAHSFYVL